MRRIVDGEEAFGVDRSIALCRRQAGMTQQLLNRTQIAASTEEVRRKAVSQGMRGGGFRKTEMGAQRRHPPLYLTRVERPAAGAGEERSIPRQRVRAGGKVVGHRFAYG